MSIVQSPDGLLKEVLEGTVTVDEEVVDEYGTILTCASEFAEGEAAFFTAGAIIDRRFEGKRVRVTVEELPEEEVSHG